jgi:polysaccharide export outer membrane protein
MHRQTFVLAIITLFISLLFSGCSTYSDLPAGTRMSIGQKSSGIIEHEIVGDSSGQQQPYKSAEYVVGPNDVLYINVNSSPEFSMGSSGSSTKVSGYRVDGSGCIYLPIAGEVSVAGMTLGDARTHIQKALLPYFNNPWVVVEIAEYRNRQVFVFGAVKKSGPIPLSASGMNLAQAIASAELRDAGASIHYVRIIRSFTPDKGELLVIDFEKVLKGKTVPMQLQEGDIVYVPKSAFGSWNDALADMLPSLQVFSSALQPFVNIKYLKQ